MKIKQIIVISVLLSVLYITSCGKTKTEYVEVPVEKIVEVPVYIEKESSNDVKQPDDIIESIDDNTDNKEDENDTHKVILEDGFQYEDITDDILEIINDRSYKENVIGIGNLVYMNVKYIDFNNSEQFGELICNKDIADDLLEIFRDLYNEKYQIEKIRLAEIYKNDTETIMANNDTCCLNYDTYLVTNKITPSAVGRGIRINPLYNPCVQAVNGTVILTPQASLPFINRDIQFDHKIDENDLAYKLFTEHGFRWAGNGDTIKDLGMFVKSQ